MPEYEIAAIQEGATHVTDQLFELPQLTSRFVHQPIPVPPVSYGETTTTSTIHIDVFVLPEDPCPSDLNELLRQNPVLRSVEADLKSSLHVATETARNSILQIAKTIAYQVLSTPRVRYAVFIEEQGGAQLVVHSRASKRQLSFEVTRAGRMTAIVIDENLRRVERKIEPNDKKMASELMEWLQVST